MFYSREKRGDDPLLQWKLRCLILGGGIMLLGMLLQLRWLVGLAMVVVFFGFLLRFFGPRDEEDEGDTAGTESDEHEDEADRERPGGRG